MEQILKKIKNNHYGYIIFINNNFYLFIYVVFIIFDAIFDKMKMNWHLAKEIYGMNPWFIDQNSLPAMMAILNNFRNGIEVGETDQKLNSTFFLKLDQKTKLVTGTWSDVQDLNSDNDFEAIAIIKIDGPITKSGGMSSYGMNQISSLMLNLSQYNKVIGFILYSDSGGGASGAVNIMRDTINLVKKTKPVYGLVEKGGYACSAMYGILASCDKIYAEDGMSVVGSVGTMIQFDGKAANTDYADGMKHIRIYATKSTKKNEAFEQALNNDNYQLLISELLDPVNESFIKNVVSDRPLLKGTDFDNGNTVFAKDAVGTYIDGLKSFDQVVKEISSDVKNRQSEPNNNNNNNQIKNRMDIATLKSLHPETYNAIFQAGVSAEQDRVGVWMAHFETDPEAVKNGVKSGKEITATQREEFIVKSSQKAKLVGLENSSPAEIATGESNDNPASEEEKEAANFYKDL